MIIRNTPSVLRMLENVVIYLSKELRLPMLLGHVPINIKTIYSNAADAILNESLDYLDITLANEYADTIHIDRVNGPYRNKIDSELLTHIFTKMCVLEFLKWVSGSKARRDCLGLQAAYDAEFCQNMLDTLKTEYNSILINYDLYKDDRANKLTVTKKKTTKPTTKVVSESTKKTTTKKPSSKKKG